MQFAQLRDELRKRRPHLAVACVAAGLGLAPAGWAPALVAAGVAAAIASPSFGARGAACALALVICSTTVGVLRVAAIDRPAKAAPPGSVVDAEATLLERPRRGLFTSSASMRIDSGPAAGLYVLARTGKWPAADPGVRFRLRGFIRESTPSTSTPSASTTSASNAGAAGSAPTGARPSEANAGTPGTPGFGPLPLLGDPR